MYRAFNLVEFPWKQYDQGAALIDRTTQIVKKALADFVNNRRIDGAKLSEHWFPQVNANVFISHSHTDLDNATNLAGFLKEEFNLDSFLDWSVWGHADALLRHIDDEYCWNPTSKTYSYRKRNGSTSHAHMMLSTALGKMLDKVECVIFLNTPNSITSEDAVSKTKSPWLYFELGLLNMIRPRKPQRLLLESLSNKRAFANLEIDYAVDLGNMPTLNEDLLKLWAQARLNPDDSAVHSLDLLYQMVPEPTRKAQGR
jgi:hypothetical protein